MLILIVSTLVYLSTIQGGVVNLDITEDVNDLINPDLLTPKVVQISIVNDDNVTELLNPDQLTPKTAAVSDRATTACGCGYSVYNPNPAAGRIVNGQEVNPQHKLPYQAYVQTCFGTSCFMCGGTLLNKRYVLTAMHCVENNGQISSNVRVALGEHDINADIEAHKAQSIKVERVITRDDYNSQTINNDIAILRLSADVEMTANVVPACLPTNINNNYVNNPAVVSGWGTTSEGGRTSNVLRETNVNIVAQSDASCTPYGNLPNTKMCAYRQNTDSCQGDSGGPLVVQEDGRNTVVGVVSYGNGCARSGYAGVYARVTTYLDWINQNIQDGWCADDNTNINFPTDAPTTTTTTTTPASFSGERCDFTCTNVGQLTADVNLNGNPARCDSGKCYAKDGSNICETFNYPCGGRPNNGGLTCSNPCLLDRAVGSYMTQYQQGQISQFQKLNVGWGNVIPSTCDLATGYCCAADYPDSDLCARLGWFGNIFG